MSYADEAGIPVEFRAALELTPNCWTLRLALADRMREQGDEIGADAVLWSALALVGVEGQEDRYGCHLSFDRAMPETLWGEMTARTVGNNTADAIGRVVIGWRKISNEVRQQLLNEARAQCELTR